MVSPRTEGHVIKSTDTFQYLKTFAILTPYSKDSLLVEAEGIGFPLRYPRAYDSSPCGTYSLLAEAVHQASACPE